jgi:hypothetical protein
MITKNPQLWDGMVRLITAIPAKLIGLNLWWHWPQPVVATLVITLGLDWVVCRAGA